jgi:cytochrome P450
MVKHQTFHWEGVASDAPLPPLIDPHEGPVNAQPLVSCYLEYGPIFRVKRAGLEPQTVLAGPEANIFIARHEDEFFTTAQHWQQFDATISQQSQSSITAARDGEANRKRRAESSRAWSRSRILDQIPQLAQITVECMQHVQPDERIAVHHQFRRIVAEQLGRLLVGMSPGDYLDDFVIYLNTTIVNTLDVDAPEHSGCFDAPAYQSAVQRVNEFGRLAYEAHLSHPQPNGKPDMIDEAMQATAQYPEPIRQTILSRVALGPMLAGIDTVANSLSFMLYALLENVEVCRRVQAEVETAFHNPSLTWKTLQQMPALYGAMRETLRRYPVAGGHLCRVAKPLIINGYRLDPGTDVYVAMTVPHFLEEYYPNPMQFDIDRFHQPRNEHRHPGVYVPFGLGNHTCLGAGIAEVQLQVTMATLLHSHTFQFDPPDYRLSIEEQPTPVPANFFVRGVPHPSSQCKPEQGEAL